MNTITVDSLAPVAAVAQEYITAMETILAAVFESEGISDYIVNLVLCDDESLSELKERYFHVHQYTDVIAFRLNSDADINPDPDSVIETNTNVPANDNEIEGEIYISLPRVKANARTYKQQLGCELARVIIHGGLHLIGYGDEDIDSKKAMREKEDSYLREINWQILNDVQV